MSDPVRELKHELLAAAERQLNEAGRPQARHNRVLLAAGALAVAGVLALVVTAPWANSTGFMERAEAALSPAGLILHYRYVETRTSKDFGCRVTTGPIEVWIDQSYPYRWRALMHEPPTRPANADERSLVCRRQGRNVELGGEQDGLPPLQFEPPNRMRSALWLLGFPFDPDPVTHLRNAIASGHAHQEGTTEVDGRAAARIRIDCPGPPCPGPSDRAYVDPDSFSLIREEWPSGFALVPFADGRQFRFDVVRRYSTFEYLPRTKANLALTDIWAQHPEALP